MFCVGSHFLGIGGFPYNVLSLASVASPTKSPVLHSSP